jgi:hypothetical protein
MPFSKGILFCEKVYWRLLIHHNDNFDISDKILTGLLRSSDARIYGI